MVNGLSVASFSHPYPKIAAMIRGNMIVTSSASSSKIMSLMMTTGIFFAPLLPRSLAPLANNSSRGPGEQASMTG
jgi:hypothetical protein